MRLAWRALRGLILLSHRLIACFFIVGFELFGGAQSRGRGPFRSSVKTRAVQARSRRTEEEEELDDNDKHIYIDELERR